MRKMIATAILIVAAAPAMANPQVYATKCQGSPANCLQEAANTCRGRYRALHSESRAGGLIADAIPGPIMWYRMTYTCGSGGQPPAFARAHQAPVMIPQYRPPMNTYCNRIGNMVNCQTY